MAESEGGLNIPIRFDTSGAEHDLERLEERAKKGVSIPTRGEGGARGVSAPTAGGMPTVTGAHPPAAAAIQAQVQGAWLRGDTAGAYRMAAQAQGMGFQVHVPELAPAAMRPMPGGYTYGGQYRSPIGPRPLPDTRGPELRERAYAHAEELDRQRREREQVGLGLRGRALEHADEFARRDRERAAGGASLRLRAEEHADEFARRDRVRLEDRERRASGIRERAYEWSDEFARRDRVRADEGMALRERAEEHAEEFARRDRVAADDQRRATQLASRGYGGGRGWTAAAGMTGMQRLSAIGNTQVPGFSMGNYFTLLFGLSEVAQTQQQIRLAAVQASVANTDIERMNLLAKGAMPTGFTGSIISMGKDSLGYDSTSRLTETITLETARRQSLDTVRDNQFRRQNEMAMLGTLGMSDYQAGREKARIQQAERHRAATRGYQEIQGQLTATEETTLGSNPWYPWARLASPLGSWITSDIKTGSRPALRDAGVIGARRGEQRDLIAEKDAANAERAAAEAQLERQHRMELASMRVEHERLAGYAAGVSRRQLDLAALRASAGAQEATVGRQFGVMSPEFFAQRQLNEATYGAAERDINRERLLSRVETQGMRRTAGFRRQNMPIEAALSGAFTELSKAVASADPEDRLNTLMAGAAGIGATAAEMWRGITTQNRAAGGEAAQANIASQTIQAVSVLRLQNRPVEAEMARIQGQRAMAHETLNRERAQRIQDAGSGLAGWLLRPGIEASYAARAGQVDVTADAEQTEFNRKRLEMIEDINLNQGSRRRQLDALLRRDQTSATVEGIVSQARDEENRMLRLGLPDKAAAARALGQQQLRLTKQDYLESFRNVEVSRNFNLSLQRREGEDPATILKNIENGINDLGMQGGGKTPEWVKPIVDAINGVVDDVGAWLTN